MSDPVQPPPSVSARDPDGSGLYFQARVSRPGSLAAVVGASLTGGIFVLAVAVRPEPWMQMLAAVGFTWTSYMGLVAGLGLSRPQPAVRIDRNGIRLDLLRPTARLAWSDIESIGSSEVLGRGTITIRPRDPAAVLAAAPLAGRVMMRVDRLVSGAPVVVTANRLDCRFKDLKVALQTAWAAHRPDGGAMAEEKLLSR